MLHNKYFEILKQFLGDYKKEIYGRGLINKVSLSQKAIALTLDELEAEGVLKSRKQGNIKLFKLNIENKEVKDLLIITEITRKLEFLKKYRKLAEIFKNDKRIIGVFGSYAVGIQGKNSDIDVFVIGEIYKDFCENYEKTAKNLGLNLHIQSFSEKNWETLIKAKNNLTNEIMQNYVIIFNAERFVNLAWKDYYGFN